jgi:hypothetical protein
MAERSGQGLVDLLDEARVRAISLEPDVGWAPSHPSLVDEFRRRQLPRFPT